MQCPNCNSANTSKVKWNWWGGLLGAALSNEHKCNSCNYKFNPNKIRPTPNISGNQINLPSSSTSKIPETCPHCKNPNTKRIRLCEWCGNQIC
jgi:transposase-like protein